MQMNMVRKGRLVLVILPAIICAVMRPAFAGKSRALYQDFEEGSGSDRFVWDVTLHGPILGLNVRF